MAQKITPIKAIRLKCLDCCCNQYKEVALCHIHRCPIWPYRIGKRPVDTMDQNKSKQTKLQ